MVTTFCVSAVPKTPAELTKLSATQKAASAPNAESTFSVENLEIMQCADCIDWIVTQQKLQPQIALDIQSKNRVIAIMTHFMRSILFWSECLVRSVPITVPTNIKQQSLQSMHAIVDSLKNLTIRFIDHSTYCAYDLIADKANALQQAQMARINLKKFKIIADIFYRENLTLLVKNKHQTDIGQKIIEKQKNISDIVISSVENITKPFKDFFSDTDSFSYDPIGAAVKKQVAVNQAIPAHLQKAL